VDVTRREQAAKTLTFATPANVLVGDGGAGPAFRLSKAQRDQRKTPPNGMGEVS
jgi:hypothetical protein